ncbi:hypothetical protein DFH28DRAFT_1109916 [Melampsora americana]|nr:hypothetical protein DFH28DRAFT_1109916 [Melampsora americana]
MQLLHLSTISMLSFSMYTLALPAPNPQEPTPPGAEVLGSQDPLSAETLNGKSLAALPETNELELNKLTDLPGEKKEGKTTPTGLAGKAITSPIAAGSPLAPVKAPAESLSDIPEQCRQYIKSPTAFPGKGGAEHGAPEKGGAEHGTPGKGGAEHGAPEKGGAEHGAPGKGGAEHGAPGKAGAEHGGPEKGGAEHGAPEKGGAEHGAPGKGGAEHGAPAKGGAEHGAPGKGGAEHGAPGKAGAEHGGPEKGGAEHGGPEKGGAEHGAPGKGGAEHGAPGKGTPPIKEAPKTPGHESPSTSSAVSAQIQGTRAVFTTAFSSSVLVYAISAVLL